MAAPPTNTPVTTDQVEIQQRLNEVLTARIATLEKSNSALSKQVELLAALSQRANEAGNSLSSNSNAIEKVGKALEQNAKNGKAASKSLTEVSKTLKDTGRNGRAAVNVFTAMWQGLKNIASVGKTTAGLLLNIVSAAYKVGRAIVSMPFAMFNGLVEMANSLPSGPNPIVAQLEQIRAAFGDLASNEGKLVSGSLKEVRGELRDLGGTGLSVARVFGPGPEGVAEAMKAFQEISTALGSSLNRMQDDLKGNIPELIMLTKGFTGSAEATAAMLKHAKSFGEDGTKYIIRATEIAQKMGKQYGVSSKVIGKSVGEMSKDISNFGNLSVEKMTAAAVYAAKLGIEIQDLGGVMNKFLNFEDAAKGAAEMAQAFGMNVDAIELMKGGPEAIEAMRKSFFASGRSLKELGTAERKYFEQISGLTGASFEAAFSAENQSLAYDKVAESAEDAGSVQENQLKVMKELAKSIERFVGSGGEGFKSFLEAMSKGFTDGFMRAGPMYRMLKNIRRAMRQVYWAFREIGSIFVKNFPGLSEFAETFGSIFSWENVAAKLATFKGHFTAFMSDLSDPSKRGSAVRIFVDKIKEMFKNFFNPDVVGGLQSSGTKIKDTLKAVFVGLATVGIEGLASMLRSLTEMLRDFSKPGDSPITTAIMGLMSTIGELFSMLWDVVKPRLLELGSAIKQWFSETLPKFLSDIDPTGVARGIYDFFANKGGTMAIGTAALVGLAPLGKILVDGAGGLLRGAATAIGELITNLMIKKVAAQGAAAATATATGAIGAAASTAPALQTAIPPINYGSIARLLVGLAGIMIAATLLMRVLSPVVEKISTESLIKMGAITLGVITLMTISAGALFVAQKAMAAGGKGFAGMLPVIATLGAVVLATSLVALGMYKILESVDAQKLETLTGVVVKLFAFGAAAFVGLAGIGAILAGPQGLFIMGGALLGGIVVFDTLLGLVLAVVPVIKALEKLPIADVDSLEKRVKIFESIATLGIQAGANIGKIVDSVPKGGLFTSPEDDARIFRESMESVATLMNAANKPIEDLKEIILKFFDSLKGIDPAILDAGSRLMSSVLPPIVRLMVIGPELFNTLMSQAGTNSKGKIDSQKLEKLTIIFKSFMAPLGDKQFITAVSEALKGMIVLANDKTLFQAADRGFDTRVKRIGNILNTMAGFTNLVAPLVQIADKFLGAGPGDAKGKIQEMMATIGDLVSIIPASIPKLVDSLVNATKNETLKGMSIDEVKKSVEKVKEIFGLTENLKTFVGTVLKTISVEKMGAAESGAAESGPEFEETAIKLPELTKAINAIFSKDLERSVNTMIGWVSMINTGKITKDDATAITAIFASMSDIGAGLEGLNKSLKSVDLGKLGNIEIFSNAIMLGGSLGNMIYRLSALDQIGLVAAQQNAAKFAIITPHIATAIDYLSKNTGGIAGVAESYMQVVDKIVELDTRFKDSKTFELATELNDLLSKSKEIKVNTEGVVYHINLQLKIDSEKFAESLVETDKVKTILRTQ